MMNAARFEEMKATCRVWEEAKQERRARKQQIIDTLGWDSPELKAWYEEDKAAAYPYTSGQIKDMRAFADSLKREDGIIEMTINEAMKILRLPNPTTAEDLGCRWRNVLNYGDKVLLAGYYYQPGKPSWFGAVYEHLDDDMTCEGTIGVRAVSDVAFEDEGAAIAWCIRQ